MHALERRLVALEHEREIEIPALEEIVQLLVVAGLDEPHLDVGPALDVAPHRTWEEAHAGALECPDAQRARIALGQRVQVRLGGPHRSRSPVSVPQEAFSRVGRGHGSRRPPGRFRSCMPAARSSAAICWLIAGWE